MIDCPFRWLKMNTMNLFFKMKILFVAIFTILLFGCSSDSKGGKLLTKVRSEHVKELYKKNQFIPSATGAGGNGKKFNLIYLWLSTKKPLTIDTARRLLLESLKDLIDRVNSFEELHPYLVEVPFGYDKYEYSIDTIDQNGVVEFFLDQPEPKHISYVLLSHGELRYNIFVKGTKKIVTLHREPYEEALKIAENEKKKGLEPVDE